MHNDDVTGKLRRWISAVRLMESQAPDGEDDDPDDLDDIRSHKTVSDWLRQLKINRLPAWLGYIDRLSEFTPMSYPLDPLIRDDSPNERQFTLVLPCNDRASNILNITVSVWILDQSSVRSSSMWVKFINDTDDDLDDSESDRARHEHYWSFVESPRFRKAVARCLGDHIGGSILDVDKMPNGGGFGHHGAEMTSNRDLTQLVSAQLGPLLPLLSVINERGIAVLRDKAAGKIR